MPDARVYLGAAGIRNGHSTYRATEPILKGYHIGHRQGFSGQFFCVCFFFKLNYFASFLMPDMLYFTFLNCWKSFLKYE